jgi:hypothetical protein
MNYDYTVYSVGEMIETVDDDIADLCSCSAENIGQGHLRDYAGSKAIAERIALLWNLAGGMSNEDIMDIFHD